MSVTGYFESIIKNWKIIKRTSIVKKQKKEILFQYQTARNYGEIDKDKQQYLDKSFKDIE